MSERFIKLIQCERSEWLQEYHPYAFLLLTLIARRARRTYDSPDGYEIGECHIGDYHKAGIPSEKIYRTAKDVLVREGIILICETCRNRKKGATGRATTGTKVKILGCEFYDINPEGKGDHKGDRRATEGRPKGDEQECKKDKKEKEEREKPPFTKIFYRDLVSLTEEQYQNLLDQNGSTKLDWMLDKLNAQLGRSGKVNKSDYHTMIKGGWVQAAWEEDQSKRNPNTSTSDFKENMPQENMEQYQHQGNI